MLASAGWRDTPKKQAPPMTSATFIGHQNNSKEAIIRTDYDEPGIQFFTPGSFSSRFDDLVKSPPTFHFRAGGNPELEWMTDQRRHDI
jgi:hypothetical protein